MLRAPLLKHLDRLLQAQPGQRRAAILALGKFAGPEVVSRLIPLVADADDTISREADACLCAQPDRELVKRLLAAAASSSNQPLQIRAGALLAKIGKL